MSLLMPEIAEQPRLLVKHRLDLLGAEPEVLKEIEHDAGIERPGPCSHAQTVERREPERAVDALAVSHRAQAGAAAEVRDDHAAVGDLGRFLRQHRGDVLVRQPVEAIALDARRADHRAAAARFRRPPAGRDGSSCRSRRPAAHREGAPRRRQSPRGCAADGGARAVSASRSSSSTCGVTIVGAANRGPPWTTRWPTPRTRAPP